MDQENQNVNISAETRNILLNIRDFIGIIAIIVLIPILAYRTAGVFIDWHGLSEKYQQTEENLDSLKESRNELQRLHELYIKRQQLRTRLQNKQEDAQYKYSESREEIRRELEEISRRIQKNEDQEALKKTEEQRIEEINSKTEELQQQIDDNKKEMKKMHKNIVQYRFYASLGIGLAALVVGILIPLFHVGIGFLIGGITTLSYGYWIYWDYMSDLLATISIICALAILTFGMWVYRPRMQ